MATSGSFQTNEYVGSKHKGLQFNWSRTGYDVAGNYSDISWEWVGYGSTSGYHELHNSYLNVDGERVYTQKSNTSINLYNGTVVASGTKRIYHNNDGTKSFSADGVGGIYAYAVNCTGSGSWTLDTIPRYFSQTPSIWLISRDETSATFGWSTSETCNWCRYHLDGASGWTDVFGGSATSGTFTVSGLGANSSHSVYLECRRQDSSLWSNSNSVSFSTHNYPNPTSVSSGSIGNPFTVNVDNPLGRQYTLQLISNQDGSILNTYQGSTNGNVTGFNDSATIDKFYQTIPNSNSGTYYAKVTYNGHNRTKGNGTYTTKTSECNPVFTTFNTEDSNSDIVAITGSNQVYVKGYSTLKVTIPSANKMTTQKYATPSSYSLSCDTLPNQSVNYSDNDIVATLGTIANKGTLRVNVRAYDSRNNNVLAYKDITVYDYAKPVVNVSATRLNNFENETTIKINGTYSKLTINNTDKNTLTGVQYRYRETGGSWGSWTNVTTTLSNGTFTCNDVILSLDNTKSFEFEIKATDYIDNTVKAVTVDIGQAIFFVSSNNKTCYINGQEILMYDVVDTW